MINRRLWRDFVENIIASVCLALFVRAFIFTGYKVPSSSMSPTLLPGDLIFTYRLPYGLKLPLTQSKLIINSPSRGDVVVFTFAEQPKVNYVKRVVGIAGDRIEIKDGQLVVNDKYMEYKQLESSVENDEFEIMQEKAPEGVRQLMLRKQSSKKSFGPIVVPPNQIFVLGDNRDSSDDSRYWGTVPIDRVEGKVELVWLSLDWSKKWADNSLPHIRSDRLFTLIK